ncbi:uncharacterized protein [Nicotiana sylvestris]|uniref:uncharacterized protein n=1 Tax=Nicotiana sylvestris TaxID=4096 RepID=UPI00388C6925
MAEHQDYSPKRGIDLIKDHLCKDMHDHALFLLREEHSYYDKECKKLTSMLQDLEAHSSRGEKELGGLRDALERALRKKADLVMQVKQNSSLISQLNTEIFGLRERNEVATGVATSQGLLKDARKEVVVLAAAKSEVEQNAATYLEDVATTHKIARDALDKLKSELLRSEAPLLEALDREKSLKLLLCKKGKRLEDKEEELGQLWGEVGRAKREFNELQGHVSAHFATKESALAMVSALETQIQNVHASDSAWENMITKLSSKL